MLIGNIAPNDESLLGFIEACELKADASLSSFPRRRESRLGKVQIMLIDSENAKFLSCLDSRLRGDDGVAI